MAKARNEQTSKKGASAAAAPARRPTVRTPRRHASAVVVARAAVSTARPNCPPPAGTGRDIPRIVSRWTSMKRESTSIRFWSAADLAMFASSASR